MNFLGTLWVFTVGLTIGGYVMWWICEKFVIKPMRNELIGVLHDNCEAMHAVVDSLNHVQTPAFIVEGCEFGDDEDEDEYGEVASDTESPPILLFSSQMIPVDDSGNQVNRTINFSEQQ